MGRRKTAEPKHDQFFIRPDVSQLVIKPFVDKHVISKIDCIYEPAAGDGGLLDLYPQAIGYDLYPRRRDIQEQDYFKFWPRCDRTRTLVLTGPPYGSRLNLAIGFLNHGAMIVDWQALILPRTFKSKEFAWIQLDPRLRLFAEVDLPENSFYLPCEGNGQQPYDVPSTMQVWCTSRRGRPPEISYKVTRDTETATDDFFFLHPERRAEADFAIKATGWSTGTIVVGSAIKSIRSPRTFQFVKVVDNAQRVYAFFAREDWKMVKCDVIGQKSLSRKDIVRAYEALRYCGKSNQQLLWWREEIIRSK